MEIKIKKLSSDAKIPTRGSSYAAGYDLYSAECKVIYGGETEMIDTGIAVEIPEGYFGAIYARSGLACKQGLRPANCVGIIDSDYRGSIKVALHNDNEGVMVTERSAGVGVIQYVPFPNHNSTKKVDIGERIAQLVIQKAEDISFVEVDELSDTARSDGGFGSSGSF